MSALVNLEQDVLELTEEEGIIFQLRALLPEPTQSAVVGTTAHHKISGSPAPWHSEAGRVYMTIHAGARRLEAGFAQFVHGRARTRGGSDGNTVAALRVCVRLAEAMPPEEVRGAARRTSSWIRRAEEIPDIGRAEPWVDLPRAPGATPPPCPFCGTYRLKLARRSGLVKCVNRACRDEDGRPRRAVIEYGALSGSAYLTFGDGQVVTYTASGRPQAGEGRPVE